MIAESGDRIFISYSHTDVEWRKRFERYLRQLFDPRKQLWVDENRLGVGDKFDKQIKIAITQSSAALILLSPEYLDIGRYARTELEWILRISEERRIRLFPILIANCNWRDTPLRELNVAWGAEDNGPLEAIADESGKNEAVFRICTEIRKRLGTGAYTSKIDRDILADSLMRLFYPRLENLEAVEDGEFAVIYKGNLDDEKVIIKAVPEAARRNRLLSAFEDAMQRVDKLSDSAFINIKQRKLKHEPRCLILDYLDPEVWPTLESRLALSGGRLEASVVVRILAQIARAQADAADQNVSVGPLSPASIFVRKDWKVRLAPFRLSAHFAHTRHPIEGQMAVWSMLTELAPEDLDRQPLGQGYDASDQYYLGRLGLQMLTGQAPVSVRCFADLGRQWRFFRNPRWIVSRAQGPDWIDTAPGLALTIFRLLERRSDDRFASPQQVVEELDALQRGSIPDQVRHQLAQCRQYVRKTSTLRQFYSQLILLRPELESKFRRLKQQPRMLGNALTELENFDPRSDSAEFLHIARKHGQYGLDELDMEAFRVSFLDVITSLRFGAWEDRQKWRDAWNCVMRRGIDAMKSELVKNRLSS